MPDNWAFKAIEPSFPVRSALVAAKAQRVAVVKKPKNGSLGPAYSGRSRTGGWLAHNPSPSLCSYPDASPGSIISTGVPLSRCARRCIPEDCAVPTLSVVCPLRFSVVTRWRVRTAHAVDGFSLTFRALNTAQRISVRGGGRVTACCYRWPPNLTVRIARICLGPPAKPVRNRLSVAPAKLAAVASTRTMRSSGVGPVGKRVDYVSCAPKSNKDRPSGYCGSDGGGASGPARAVEVLEKGGG